MRDFRYLRVIESSTDWLPSCNLLVDGVYMKYVKITEEIRENEIPKRKTTRLPVLLFFSIDQNLMRYIYTVVYTAYNCILIIY